MFFALLPCAIAAATILLFGAHTVPRARRHSYGVLLAIHLLTAMAVLGLTNEAHTATISASQLLLGSLAMLAASIIAAPLLDRARSGGLVFASVSGGLLAVWALAAVLPSHLPFIDRPAICLLILFASGIFGLIGSAHAPIHPARNAKKLPEVAPAWILAGCVLLATALLGSFTFVADSDHGSATPMILSAMVAASLGLWRGLQLRHPHTLAYAGYGLVAGLLAAALAPPSLLFGLVAGMAAATCLQIGEAIDPAIELDDPSRQLSMLVLPALLGLLLPTLHDFHLLAVHLRWIGAALLGSVAAAAVLWNMAKILFGLQAASRRVREGLDSF